jgi:hypothetical protein
MLYACLSSLCNTCVMQSIFALLYLYSWIVSDRLEKHTLHVECVLLTRLANRSN